MSCYFTPRSQPTARQASQAASRSPLPQPAGGPRRSTSAAGRIAAASQTDAADRTALHRRNQRWLEAYVRCRHTPGAISLRNRLVEHNLPLVLQVAHTLRHRSSLPFEDMVQVGSLGLIRAIEAWDGRRDTRLSSFAVPYIRGAIQREIRDRLALLRIPRPLWELRQRASALQERQRRQNRPALTLAQLAETLACSRELLEESLQLGLRATPCSLDAPRAGGDAATPTTLLEALADPASEPRLAEEHEAGEPLPSPRPEWQWLQGQLLRLDPTSRLLLEGRLLQGSSWPELARQVGLSPAAARRRVETLLRQLRQGADHWLAATAGEPLASRAG